MSACRILQEHIETVNAMKLKFLRAWDSFENGILKSYNFKDFNVKSVIVVGKTVRRIISRLGKSIHWLSQKYLFFYIYMYVYIYIYTHVCVRIYSSPKWKTTRLEITTNLSSLSFISVSHLQCLGWAWTASRTLGTEWSEEFLGGRKWKRLETTWLMRQHLLTGTRK